MRTASATLIDEKLFRELFEPLSGPQRLRLLEAAAGDLEALSAGLGQAQQAGDGDGAARAAHSLKGAAGGIGGIALVACLDRPGEAPGVLDLARDTIAAAWAIVARLPATAQ